MNFGDRVKSEREARDWTQARLAEEANKFVAPGGRKLIQDDISKLEVRSSKNSGLAPAVSRALGRSLDYMLTGRGPKDADDPPGQFEEAHQDSRQVLTRRQSPRSLQAKIDRSDLHLVPRLDVRAGMGNGVMIRDVVEIIEHVGLNVPELCRVRGVSITSPANLRIITGYGPSMRPTFDHLDQLLVDTGVNDLRIDDVYCLEDDEDLYIKRLQRIPGKKNSYMMISDNKDFHSFPIEDPLRSGFRVHGRVVIALKLEKV